MNHYQLRMTRRIQTGQFRRDGLGTGEMILRTEQIDAVFSVTSWTDVVKTDDADIVPVFETRSKRSGARHGIALPCEVVSLSDMRSLGDYTIDVSNNGLLLACDKHVRLGTQVLVNMLVPFTDLRLFGKGVVSRVTHGRRENDTAPAIGIELESVDADLHHALEAKLAKIPPRVPMRHLRRNYAGLIEQISSQQRPELPSGQNVARFPLEAAQPASKVLPRLQLAC